MHDYWQPALGLLGMVLSVFVLLALARNSGIEEGRRREREWQATRKEVHRQNEVQKEAEANSILTRDKDGALGFRIAESARFDPRRD